MSDLMDMTGKVVFVTGASSRGIGSGIARKMAEHGADVFLVARREEGLRKIAAEIEELGVQAGYAVCDVSSEESVGAAVEACIERFGKMDSLVMAAGIAGDYVEGVDFDLEDWETVLGINLNGMYYCLMHAYEHLKKQPGATIVPISSKASLRVNGCLPYTATKGAIFRMVPWLAVKMGADGIRVNAIAPGLIDTDMTNPPGWDTTDMILNPAAEKTPLKRLATIEDCANTALFLASDASRGITGNTIPVDCGEWVM